MSSPTLDDVMNQGLKTTGVAANTFGSLDGFSSAQAAINYINADIVALEARCQQQLELARQQLEADQNRAREALEYQLGVAESAAIQSFSSLLQPIGVEAEIARLDAVRETLNLGLAQQSIAALTASAACGISDGLLANAYGPKTDFPKLTGIASSIGLLDSSQSSSALSACTGLAESLLFGPSVSSLSAQSNPYLNSIQDSFQNSFADDLQESLLDYQKQEAERLKKLTDTITQVRTLGETRSFGSYSADEIERLGARHGTQFTIRQLWVLEAVARTAERLLSIRDRRKIGRKLPYIAYIASSGSKILLLYFWLLLLLWGLLVTVDLFDSLQLQRTRQAIKCLSPPLDQPLSRTPKVKPNAPNIAA